MTTGENIGGNILEGIRKFVHQESYADWCVLIDSPHYKIRDELNDIFIRLDQAVVSAILQSS